MTLPVTTDLYVRYDASAITGLANGDPVAQWDDLSGNDLHLVQGTAGNRPTYQSEGLDGLPSLRFSGPSLDQKSMAVTFPSALTGPRTVFTVNLNPSNTSAIHVWLSGDGGGLVLSKWSNDDRWIVGHATSSGSFLEFFEPALLGEISVWSAIIGSATSLVRVDGSQRAAGSISSSSLSGIVVGRDLSSTSRFYVGDLSEVLIYDRELSTEEIEDVEDYLTAKWFGAAGPTTFELTTNTVGNGSITLDPPGGTYDENEVVEATAVPDSGWSFDAWSGDLTGSTNPQNITMDANKSITATFTEDPGEPTYDPGRHYSTDGGQTWTLYQAF